MFAEELLRRPQLQSQLSWSQVISIVGQLDDKKVNYYCGNPGSSSPVSDFVCVRVCGCFLCLEGIYRNLIIKCMLTPGSHANSK